MSHPLLKLIDPARVYPAGWPAIVEHPVVKLPTRESVEGIDQELVRKFMWERHELIERMVNDPLNYGYSPPSWQRVESILAQQLPNGGRVNQLLIMGGNRSGKSRWAAKKVIEIMRDKPDARAWCFQTTHDNSIRMQQPYIYEMIPPEWRNAKKGKVTDVTYRRKTGFSEGTFILPNHSQGEFRNYAQDITTIEGGEIDVAWCDELVPYEVIKTLLYRLVTRNGLLIVTFTPIEGYSSTVKTLLAGAETIEETDAELLPRDPDDLSRGFEQVPLVQLGHNDTARIVYFHTSENPFSGYERLKQDLQKAKREDILCRAYGVPTKSIGNRFPKFSDTVHVIDESKLPQRGTWYHICDPCSGRNWFMIWALVTPDGKIIQAREWPQPDDYIEGIGLPGDWTEPDGKKADGKRGGAQKPFGFGLDRYRAEIARVEKELWQLMHPGESNPATKRETMEQTGNPFDDGSKRIEIFERIMDSRYGNAPTLAKQDSTTLIQELADLGVTFTASSTIRKNLSGLDLINDRLDYDKDAPLDHFNQPKFYIVRRCKNTIYALKEWTGLDGLHGACKDPIDNLRYLLSSNPIYADEHTMQPMGGGSY